MQMPTDLYILDDKTPIPCADETEWQSWLAANPDKVQVGFTQHDDISVKTVFSGVGHPGLDHTGATVPMVFETRIVGGRCHNEAEGYTTWEDAERGHAEHVHRAFYHSHLCPAQVTG